MKLSAFVDPCALTRVNVSLPVTVRSVLSHLAYLFEKAHAERPADFKNTELYRAAARDVYKLVADDYGQPLSLSCPVWKLSTISNKVGTIHKKCLKLRAKSSKSTVEKFTKTLDDDFLSGLFPVDKLTLIGNATHSHEEVTSSRFDVIMNPMFVEVTDQWGTTKHKRRVRASPKNPSKITRMNEAVFQWFKLQRSMNLEVDNGQLCDKALVYSQILKVSLHFTASRGWLTRFKERHGIADIKSSHQIQCKTDTDKVFVSHLKANLREENMIPSQVYCVDETVLLWKEPPPSAPPDMLSHMTEPAKDKITIITCTNMDATHKLSLNIVGRYTEPVVEGGGLSGTAEPGARHSVGLQTDEEPATLAPTTAATSILTEQQQQSLLAGVSEEERMALKSLLEGLQGKLGETTSEDAISITTVDQQKQRPSLQQPSPDQQEQYHQQTKLLYRKGDTHELTGDIFADWFYSTFVPQVRASLTARGLPAQAVLILDNSLYHAAAQLTDSTGKIKTIRVPCYVANKSLPSAPISQSLKLRYKTRIAREWVKDKEFCNKLNLRRCFEMLKEEWGAVNNITTSWKNWYQIDPLMPSPNVDLIRLEDILKDIPAIIVKQWSTMDDRPSEVPFRIPNELELLDIATEICHARLGPIKGEPMGSDAQSPMIDISSDFMDSERSPPTYDEALSSSPTEMGATTTNDMIEETLKRRQGVMGDHADKRHKPDILSPAEMLMSSSKSMISQHSQNIIDSILRASMMTSLPGPIPSPNMQPFSPLSPSPTFSDKWPAIHALMGITNAVPRIVSKNDALMGLDKFIAFMEQQNNVAEILKDVLYEFKKYALHKL